MSEVIKTSYRNVDIEYSEPLDRWVCFLESQRYEKESLSMLKKRIDAWYKSEANFSRTPVLDTQKDYRSNVYGRSFTVTSVTDEGDWWLIDSRGDRSKMDAKYVSRYCADTEANRCTLVAANRLVEQALGLQKQAEEMVKTCSPVVFTKPNANVPSKP